jgi:hypothetical protein
MNPSQALVVTAGSIGTTSVKLANRLTAAMVRQLRPPHTCDKRPGWTGGGIELEVKSLIRFHNGVELIPQIGAFLALAWGHFFQ